MVSDLSSHKFDTNSNIHERDIETYQECFQLEIKKFKATANKIEDDVDDLDEDDNSFEKDLDDVKDDLDRLDKDLDDLDEDIENFKNTDEPLSSEDKEDCKLP